MIGGDVRCDPCPLVLCQEFAPSDEELEAYRKGEEWDPKLAEQRRRLKVRLHALGSCFIETNSLP